MRCPDCERPNQFGELCESCRRERQYELQDEYEPEYGGAFDGFNVTSDADPGL